MLGLNYLQHFRQFVATDRVAPSAFVVPSSQATKFFAVPGQGALVVFNERFFALHRAEQAILVPQTGECLEQFPSDSESSLKSENDVYHLRQFFVVFVLPPYTP